MTALLRHWQLFWFEKRSAEALAVFRIGFGLFLMTYALSYFPHLTEVFSNKGLVIPLVLHPPSALAPLLQPPHPAVIYLLALLFLCAAFGLTVGYRANACAWALLALGAYFWQLQLHLFTASFVRLIIIILPVLALSGCSKALSLDMKRKHGSFFAHEDIEVFAQRLLCVQLSVTYFAVALQKVVLDDWQSGEVLTYSLIGLWGSPLAYWLVSMNIPLRIWDVLTQAVIALELLAAFGLWHRKTQIWWMASGAVFHIFIAVFLQIWWFVFLLPMYVLFFPEKTVSEFIVKICKASSFTNRIKINA